MIGMQEDMLLKDYRPVSELKTEVHEIRRPCCPVFDMHVHFGAKYRCEYFEKRYDFQSERFRMEQMGIQGAADLSIFPGDAYERERKKTESGRDFLYYFAPLDYSRAEKPDFEADIRRQFERYDSEGIAGIKIWKNLTLVLRSEKGAHFRITDERFRVIWEEAEKRAWPVLIHMADPPAFFKRPDGFNERAEELLAMPKWCYAGDPDLSFEKLMEQQEELVAENPGTTFVVAHMGSWAENLRQVGKWLDSYPNMYIDTAACLAELGRQPYTSAEFFRRYQDRILFGSDYFAGDEFLYPIWFRFFETRDEYFSYDGQNPPGSGRWYIYGIGLEKEILRKIYRENAQKVLKINGRKEQDAGTGNKGRESETDPVGS